MSFDFYKKAILTVLVGYFVLGMYSGSRFNKGQKEPYPVFSWALFDKVPTERHKYTIKIYRLGQTEFSEPVSFKDAVGLYKSRNFYEKEGKV